MKKKVKLSIGAAALLGTGIAVFAFLNAHAVTVTEPLPLSAVVAKPALTSVPAPTAPAPEAPVKNETPATTGNAGVLNEQRQFALGMIETGNDDREVGSAGEISRYQIKPAVWRQYSHSHNYQNPATSLEVARLHWTALAAHFKKHAHRNPTDFDMYVLWNAGYTYYAGKGFNPAHVSRTERDRAQRFANLCECSDLLASK